MKISNAVRLILCMAVFVAPGFFVRAESGEQRASMPDTRSTSPLRIVDQNGHPVMSGVPSATNTIVDVTVAPSGTFTFNPSTVNISVGDTVRWTWAASGHSVTSGNPCTADQQFCSPNNTNCSTCVTSTLGFVYEFTFTQVGNFSYFCCVHCSFGMVGTVNVSAAENIVLTARGRVVGGINTSRLAWTGAAASNIDVYRNGTVIATVPNNGHYNDSTGTTGRQSFIYKVCDSGTSTCSNQVTVRFR